MLMYGVSMRCDKNSTHTHTHTHKIRSCYLQWGCLNPKQYNSHNTQIKFERSFSPSLYSSVSSAALCCCCLNLSTGLVRAFFVPNTTRHTDYNVFSMKTNRFVCAFLWFSAERERERVRGSSVAHSLFHSVWIVNTAVCRRFDLPRVLDNDSNCNVAPTLYGLSVKKGGVRGGGRTGESSAHSWHWRRRDNFTKFQLTNAF